MPGTCRVIFWDQLTPTLPSLIDIDRDTDTVLMVECPEQATAVKHHVKKLVLLFSAMRHFAAELKAKHIRVNYIKLDQAKHPGNIEKAVARHCRQHRCEAVAVTQPSEYRLSRNVAGWQRKLKIPVTVHDDTRFLCTPEEFALWAKSRKEMRMEHFYRTMRQRHQILMNGDKPAGGKWNFDKSNRQRHPSTHKVPSTFRATTDSITQQVIKLVKKHFPDHFGNIEPFHFAVNRQQAKRALSSFIRTRLKEFGQYQDAMQSGEPWMYHAHIGFYLNCGLLSPLECIEAAEEAYRKKQAPINSVEGFIRQILGWREFIRGIYWLGMPEYEKKNALHAKQALPKFYWTAETPMNCMRHCIEQTRDLAYAHHIQRLMVLGNFALLAGLDPKQVNEWYWIVYADAYQWVELPNVSGMILYADGGMVASKPYAASGAYINKMSDYCQDCQFNVKKKVGEDACPFNYLYWHFMKKHQAAFKKNPRMSLIGGLLKRIKAEDMRLMQQQARRFLKEIDQ